MTGTWDTSWEDEFRNFTDAGLTWESLTNPINGRGTEPAPASGVAKYRFLLTGINDIGVGICNNTTGQYSYGSSSNRLLIANYGWQFDPPYASVGTGTFDVGDYIDVAVDRANGKVWFGKNGAWQGDPDAGTGGISCAISGDWYPYVVGSIGSKGTANFADWAAVTGTPVGLASETDVALARPAVQIRAVGLASEADTALARAAVQVRATGLATETDAAIALGVARPVGRADQTSAALALGGVALRGVGRADATDAALALAAVAIKATGLATETDQALALSAGSANDVGLAVETDVALALGVARPVGLATETASAQVLAGRQLRPVGMATETALALALDASSGSAVGLALETSSALALPAVQRRAVGLAASNDTALALLPADPAGEVPAERRSTKVFLARFDPSDVDAFEADFADRLGESETIASVLALNVNAAAASWGFGIRDDAPFAPLADGKVVRFWPIVNEGDREAVRWNRFGRRVKFGVTVAGSEGGAAIEKEFQLRVRQR